MAEEDGDSFRESVGKPTMSGNEAQAFGLVSIEKGNRKVSFSELGAPSQKPCICKIPTTRPARPAGTEKYMTSLGDNYSSPLRLKVHGGGVYSQ